MSSRRDAREMALKVLYTMELTNNFTDKWQALAENAFSLEKEYALEEANQADDTLKTSQPVFEANPLLPELVTKTVYSLSHIDQVLSTVLENWSLERVSIIDRNILRIGIAELLYCADIPANVTINEWIEVAKRFGSDDSPKFINGILDKISITFTTKHLAQPIEGNTP